MLELLKTPTFVIDDLFDSKDIRLFDYLKFENIPFEVLELCAEELPHREDAYYPIVLNNLEKKHELFKDINPRALALAQEQKLTLVFIYTGTDNLIFHLADTLLVQLIKYKLDFSDIRIVSEVTPLVPSPSQIYFSFNEMEAYLEVQEGEFVDEFCESERTRTFSIDVEKDTSHARLFCASVWYHALNVYSYMNYPVVTTGSEIIDSPIYTWSQHWSATETLIDMFGQQLPVVNLPGYKLDLYNNAYWNFSTMPSFSEYNLSLSKNIFLPILNLQPFVIIGPPDSLSLLRSLGYQTFGEQINESYDTIRNDEARMQGLFRLVYEMSHYTGQELATLNEKLRSIIKHNQIHFLSSKKFKLISLLNALKDGS